jgi:hypothetical protein
MELKKAMRLYDIKIIEATRYLSPRFELGKRIIYRTSPESNLWFNNDADYEKYTESQAVAWMIEGATPKAKEPPYFDFPNIEVDLHVSSTEAQKLIDALYRAGYRPNKDKPIS